MSKYESEIVRLLSRIEYHLDPDPKKEEKRVKQQKLERLDWMWRNKMIPQAAWERALVDLYKENENDLEL